MNPEKIRKDFPVFQNHPDLAYLDSAATSQKPEKVINAVEKFYRRQNSNIGRGLYDLANSATQIYSRSREKVAEFIGAEPEEVVFVRNTTEAENLLAYSYSFEGNIVLSKMAHHSEQLPWRRKSKKEDKDLKYIQTENGKLSLESAKEIIDQDTGLVAISHVSNVFGAENPVREIIKLAHENNAVVILDAAQSAPHMNLDVKDLNADFMCFSGHKILGPSGTGILYGRKELMKGMEPYQIGGGMVNSVEKDKVDYSTTPDKFEAGTPNVAGAAGMNAAIEYLESIGMKQIKKHTEEISDKIWNTVDRQEGFENISPEGANIVSFKSEYAHPHDVAEVLNQYGVAVRAGQHCAQPQVREIDVNGTARASTHVYNTEKDVKKLEKGLEEVRNLFG
ncbi:aminotransferase class V-fold PLP-dependent enzyme [Nanohaloarchaea archaeon]|nr:aminotransferase class V-fold PLP-dependent enzyme [Candidatus Nanohaloarchaea archaeon]